MPDKHFVRSNKFVEYDLIDALRRAKVMVMAGDYITDLAADLIVEQKKRIAELEAKLSQYVACQVKQYSDQMRCPCGNVWDANDPEPPACKKVKLDATA